MTREGVWELANDLAVGLASQIPGPVGRSLEHDFVGDSEQAHYVATGPADDRSQWCYTSPGAGDATRGQSYRFSEATLSSARRSLTLIVTVLCAERAGSRGWRWRLATRIIETSHPLVVAAATAGDDEAIRLLPLHTWVRWRLLSEPFRAFGQDRKTDEADASLGQDHPRSYARGALGGWHSLKRRAADSRIDWAETLLRFQDFPTLAAIDVEKEGRLLVFEDGMARRPLSLEPSKEGPDPGGALFSTWFAREFYTRRFMVLETWRTVRSKFKWATALLAVATAILAVIAAVTVAPTPLGGDPNEGVPHLVLAVLLVASVAATIGSLVAGVIWSYDGERFAYPFLVRFGASTTLGSAAVITMRGAWIRGISYPVPGYEWRSWMLLGGLLVAGMTYLFVEARLHAVSPRAMFVRTFAIWGIGLLWALLVAAIDVLVIAPVFTEDFLLNAVEGTRWWGFGITTLASLDLGIFFQILWDDRPITYPLGAMRFQRS